MNTDRWLRIKEIFRGALEHGPRERGPFLDEACGKDLELRGEVEGLLSSHDGSDAFLEPPSGAGLLDDDWEEELSLTRIGQYLIQEAISSGGMGTVYKALQENPKRIVAIKVMREGIASRSALKRFEYESQILARLTHPNIAQVIEAGTHRENGRGKTDGLPYFVMEYIPDARSVTEYAMERKLALSRRLNLFLQVCEAVHHGHQKGIIHRDLKPSNILVNASGQVKIIDFGVARATDSDLTLTTARTDVGKLIGTVQYMSPEQCTADPNDIDTRSDVYALGVVLYELLCEALPYDVRNAAVFEATRVIRERDPKKPSTIKRTLRGDIETIVLKALEKDRGQRYQTVAAFATDIRRFLDGEVILARPAGPMTRTLKQIRRNPILSTAVAVAVAAIVIFAGYVLFVSNPQLRRERDVAEEKTKRAVDAERTAVEALEEAESQRAAARAAQLAAEKKANINMALYQYLSDMLSSPMPVKDGREVRVLDIIDGAEKKLDTAFIDQPEIEVYLRSIIGKTYKSLGRFVEAARQFRAGMELSRRTHGEEYRNTLLHMVDLGHTLSSLGEHREAESILRETIELQSRSSGKEHANTLYAKSVLAAALKAQGKYAEAESIFREVIELQRRTIGDDHVQTLFSMKHLADLHFLVGRYAEAESLYRKIMEDRRRVSGEKDPATIFAMKGLADTLRKLDKNIEAESMTREILEIFRRIYGDEDMDTLETMSCLALLLRKRNAFNEAESLLREVVEISRRVYGDEHKNTLAYLNNVATVLLVQDKRAEAKTIIQKVLEIRRRVSGEEDSNTLGAMTNLAIIHYNEGNYMEAERLHREVLEIRRRISGEDHPHTLQAKMGLVEALLGMKKYREAERVCGELFEIYRQRLGSHHTVTLEVTRLLAKALRKMGDFDEAEALYLEGLEIARNKQPPNDYEIANFHSEYGKGLFYEERYEESEKHLREAYRIFIGLLGERHKDTLNVVRFFIMLYDARGDEEEADKWRAKLASAVPQSGDL